MATAQSGEDAMRTTPANRHPSVRVRAGGLAGALLASWLLATAASAAAADGPLPPVGTTGNSANAANHAQPTAKRREAGTDKPAAQAAPAERKPAPRTASTTATRRSSPLKIDLKQAARAADQPKPVSAASELMAAPAATELTPQIKRNLYGPATVPGIEMGDRPAGSLGLCGDGSKRRFGEIDAKTAAAMLPELPAMRPRTICARRGTVIADYMFR